MQNLDGYAASGEREDNFDRMLDDALAAAPKVEIHPDFARRISVMVPPMPLVRRSAGGYARRSIVLGAAALLAVLLLLAPRTAHGINLPALLEWIFCAQLSLLALLAVSPWSPWRLRG